jgi:hypothetical protein
VEITLAGDGHYGTPEVMDLLEDRGSGTYRLLHQFRQAAPRRSF